MNKHTYRAILRISRILQVGPEGFLAFVSAMEDSSMHSGVVEKILEENDMRIVQTRKRLGIASEYAKDITYALEEAIRSDDAALFFWLASPNLADAKRNAILQEKAYEVVGGKESGFFLRKEKARQMILENPPQNMLKGFGYKDAKELLEKELFEEVFAALRFIETREWMNTVFVKAYETLTPNDFEERPLELFVLQKKWLTLAETFVKKKYHNVSHLKELGVIFVIPIDLNVSGDTLRLFSLMLHYLHEVPFYAKLIRRYSLNADTFSTRLMSLIRGDVGEVAKASFMHPIRWLIVQRYLAKDNLNDPRLFIPHVNPEAIHWRKAQRDFADAFKDDASFHAGMFYGLDCVGDFFATRETAKEALVSFDLIDNVMGFVQGDGVPKYVYHQREALWNRIFSGFVGEERMEELIIDNFDKGYIEFGV